MVPGSLVFTCSTRRWAFDVAAAMEGVAGSLLCASVDGARRKSAAHTVVKEIVSPNFVIMHSLLDLCRSTARRACRNGPSARTAHAAQKDFHPGQRESPLHFLALSADDAKSDVALLGQRCQEAPDLALERKTAACRR